MKNTKAYALAVVFALGAAMALAAPPQPTSETAENPPSGTPSVSFTPAADALVESNFATETVVFSDDEGRVIEVAAAEYRSSTTTTTSATVKKTAAPPTTTSSEEESETTTTTTTEPPSTTTTTTEASTGSFNSSYESEFYSLINSHRTSNGLQGLTRNSSLNQRAREWAKYLASVGELRHSDLSSLIPPWTAAGENVGEGHSVTGLFDAFKTSSFHNSVMLGDYTHVGIGAWVEPDGTIWTVHVFAHD